MSLTLALRRAAQQRPTSIATVTGDRRRSYAELADRVQRFAGALREMGLRRGDRVAMLALNSDRYVEYMLAVWWVGGAVNPVNTRWSPKEIAYSLDDCDTRILLVDDAFAGQVADIRKASRCLATVIHAGDGPAPQGLPSYEVLLAQAEPVEDALCADDELAGVFYTGGTTGFPKGVMLTHTNLLTNALGYLLDLPYDEDEVILGVAPIFHQAGLCVLVRSLLRASRLVLVPAFSPPAVMQAIQDERASFTLLVPTMIQMLVDDPLIGNYDLSSLRKLLYGASPISEALLDRAFDALPGVQFMQGYGLTEGGGPFTLLAHHYHTAEGRAGGKLRSCGRPVWGMEIRVVDAEGIDLPPGTVGELIARGPGVMLGYWNKPAETAAALRDGWLWSGDAGYLGDDGLLYLVDRTKDMIVSGGENVYSAEVENAVSSHPAVASCAVIGIPDDKWGEAVHAVVVLKAGQSATIEIIREHCKQHIAGYKCPRSVEFRDSLPLSGPGKVLKYQLREPYWKDRQRRIG